jgi:hypothetical protein
MPMNQLYEQAIKPLSMVDPLRLAALILNHNLPHAVVDYSDEWSVVRQRHVTRGKYHRLGLSPK